MKKIRILLIFLAVVLWSTTILFAEEAKLRPVSAGKKAVEMSKEELLAEIKETIDSEEDVFDYIPELKKETDKEGKVFYTYEGIRLEDIDKERLEKVLGRVHNQVVMIRTDRINRQLEIIRQAQRVSTGPPRIPTAVTPPPQPVTPPTAVTLPKPPPIPPTPPRK